MERIGVTLSESQWSKIVAEARAGRYQRIGKPDGYASTFDVPFVIDGDPVQVPMVIDTRDGVVVTVLPVG